ncbi:mechanosensitive ion channel family protein [Desulfurobacterium atlanticum]|uniref:Small conductance mechanosensitive channel n=1 Tax=Desulfurobacterium atlanticum TaxID=240169 RepID=A0A238ZGS6_9BACT|nr:mechanosensitive ion channel domain-containing protein [Desulfurobacterium atlanticum]SNR81874.1 small conductance mechanosensitive channel [Desulfurobacterium atlanticum]
MDVLGILIGLAIPWIVKIVSALVVFVVGKWISKRISLFLGRALERAKVDETLVKFLETTAYIVLLVLVIIAALGTLGINTTSFAAIIGAFGLAVGFAVQSNISNIGAGILLILLKPFKKGDFVEVAGTSGTVEVLGILNTKLKTPDNVVIFVPNSSIIGGNIKNYSLEPIRRVDLTIGIGYEDDIKKAKDVLMEIISSDERILSEPAPSVGVAELADSSINLFIRPWVKKEDYWSVRSDLLEKIKEEFDKNGISIPYPQMDVHADVKINKE